MSHTVIYIPGLGDKQTVYRIGQGVPIKLWRIWHRVHTHYFQVRWADSSESFASKKQRLFALIDSEIAKGRTVSLVAASAGASLAVLALKEHGKVHKAVSICGKLRNPQTLSHVTYKLNPAFKASLDSIIALEPTLTITERRHILHVNPRQDSIVPVGDNYIKGAASTIIPTSGHVFSIVCALLFFSGRIIAFIRS